MIIMEGMYVCCTCGWKGEKSWSDRNAQVVHTEKILTEEGQGQLN